ncbi:hypothetical protein ACS0TY_022846 [Phlomoides rotata]
MYRGIPALSQNTCCRWYYTHLYTQYRHKLLIANTLDANQKIISVAYAIVDDESSQSWKWFLRQVPTAIPFLILGPKRPTYQ